MNEKWLLWDFDGTLGYRPGMWTEPVLEVLRRYEPTTAVVKEQISAHLQAGFPWHEPQRPHTHVQTSDQWWAELEPVFRRAYEAVGVPAEQASRLAGQVRAVFVEPSVWRLFDDTLPTLERLSADGWRHAILSNHVPELGQIVQHLGLAPHVQAIINSAETGYEKPHPQAFAIAMEAIGRPAKVVMIGDSFTADVQGAAAAGLSAILVRKQHPEARICCATWRLCLRYWRSSNPP